MFKHGTEFEIYVIVIYCAKTRKKTNVFAIADKFDELENYSFHIVLKSISLRNSFIIPSKPPALGKIQHFSVGLHRFGKFCFVR